MEHRRTKKVKMKTGRKEGCKRNIGREDRKKDR